MLLLLLLFLFLLLLLFLFLFLLLLLLLTHDSQLATHNCFSLQDDIQVLINELEPASVQLLVVTLMHHHISGEHALCGRALNVSEQRDVITNHFGAVAIGLPNSSCRTQGVAIDVMNYGPYIVVRGEHYIDTAIPPPV